MALLDNNKDILPLSSISELLATKVRTLKMYEDKSLLPKKQGNIKKLYSINDIQVIALVHYLASANKVNANGIKYILEIINSYMDEKTKARYLHMMEEKMKKISGVDIKDIESF